MHLDIFVSTWMFRHSGKVIPLGCLDVRHGLRLKARTFRGIKWLTLEFHRSQTKQARLNCERGKCSVFLKFVKLLFRKARP